MKKYKPNRKYNPKEVDSGFIYSELKYQSEKYYESIHSKFRATLMGLLINKKIITIPCNDETSEMVNELEKHWDISISSNDNQNKVDYFCFTTPELGRFITRYDESCIVQFGEKHFGWDSFDLYFALKLNLSDLLLIDNFLDYQLETYFKDTEFFKRFLDQIIRKYQNEFLSKEVIETVNTWKPKTTKSLVKEKKTFPKKEDWQKGITIFMQLLKETEKEGFIVSDTTNQNLSEAFSSISQYEKSSLNNALSALKSKNDKQIQFVHSDFLKVEKLLKAMSNHLNILKSQY